MAHSFDTHLASAQRTLIRAGAVSLLSGLLVANGGYLQAVIPYGGIVRGYTDEIGLELLKEAFQGRAPAIAIALGDCSLSPAGIGGYNFTGELELVAYHYSNHPRNVELGRLEPDVAALASDTADPGLDIVMEHTMELLIGQRCGASASIKQIRPSREEELRTENGFSLWAQRFDITVTRNINKNRTITQLITEFRSNVRTSDAPTTVISASPVGATEAGTVATYTTTTNHGLTAGKLVDIVGVAVAGYNGSHAILATPTPTTFTVQLAIGGLAASGGGTVTTPPVAELQDLTT